jgi:VWFA-related protein
VLSSEFVDLGAVVAAPSTAGIRDGAEAPAHKTVSGSAGRLVVLVVDRGELSAGAAHKATQAAAGFLERLPPADRVAVFSLPSGPRLDFTSDRSSVAAALGRIGPARDIVPGQAASLGQRLDANLRSATDRLNALEALVRAMREIPGPKVMVVISGGLTALEAPMESEGRDPRDPLFGLSGQLAAGVVQHLRRIATAAAAARTTFYSVYVSDRAAGSEASNSLYDLSNVSASVHANPGFRVAALETLTAMNGGAMFEVVAGADRAFERVASEISGQYLLGLEPADGDRDGKPHTIEVKVRRKRVAVRARRQFVIVPPTPGGRS